MFPCRAERWKLSHIVGQSQCPCEGRNLLHPPLIDLQGALLILPGQDSLRHYLQMGKSRPKCGQPRAKTNRHRIAAIKIFICMNLLQGSTNILVFLNKRKFIPALIPFTNHLPIQNHSKKKHLPIQILSHTTPLLFLSELLFEDSSLYLSFQKPWNKEFQIGHPLVPERQVLVVKCKFSN